MRTWTLVVVVSLFSSCELLEVLQQQGLPQIPGVTFKSAALHQSPSQQQFEAYYCPQVVPDPLGPGSASLLCSAAFGAKPKTDAMQVAFNLLYNADNPNRFPVPLAEMLTAVTVFPGKTKTKLGAACVKFCAEGDATCNGSPDPDSCKSSDADIKSLEDFQNAATDLVIAKGIEALAGGEPSFKAPQLAALADSDIGALFAFGPDPLLTVLEQVATQSVQQLSQGQAVTFDVPYQLEGTVWFDVGDLGKVPVGFGPVEGSWRIPVEALLPK